MENINPTTIQQDEQEEVRIRLKSTRFDAQASLFTEEDAPLCPIEDKDPEPEVIEINARGVLCRRDGRMEISYEETEATGMAGSVTAISFREDEAGVVSMIREGAVSTVLVFEEGCRHHCLYQTPFMPFEVCVHTLKVDNRLLCDGHLSLDYIIEIRGARAERTKFEMDVL